MKPNDRAYISQQDPFAMNNPGFYGSPYPGIGNPYAGISPNLPAVANPQVPGVLPSAGAAAGGAAGGFNFGQIKGIVDRMGGIDGIIGTMTRVQRMVQSFQQVAPMFKLLMSSFAKASTAKAVGAGNWPKRSRKRRSSGLSAQHRRKGKKGTAGKSRVIKGTKRK